MIVTAQRGRGQKIHLLVDGEYVITTDVDFWYANYIADGTVLTEEEWQMLCAQINGRKALQKAVDFLSRREYSRKELLQKLLGRFDRPAAEQAVERMDELGYLDDEKYARSLTAFLIKSKGFSIMRVKRELAARGVDREISDLVLSEIQVDAVAAILTLLQRKYARKLSDEKGKRQVIAALQRLGYGYGDIRSAFSRYDTEFDEYEE